MDLNLSDSLVRALSEHGYSSSHQAETWRIVNRPLCPIKVQIEIRDTKEGILDLIPLSAYTESLDERYPLASLDLPHVTSHPFTKVEDIDAIIDRINRCFPKR